ncbi:M24 family metallopeptidase [Candidatus Carsonella ruddii]|uniref:Methionine aminopeptidase n=1 Tax=Candidatus Carsonella ruddii PC isolate NHV TaxID=1202540 RepID=J3VQK2_CARRU|nr:M24 family metallopeptidase [Candidatus Carsonella ruddii]AFP84246.1 methionine aminopeptidase [Candidatus Carsonella ruddii PC isolate NHV]
MNYFHIKNFIKCGNINSNLISIISNYCFFCTLAELDYIILYYIKILKVKSSTINFKKYKFCSCLSISNIICHGIPIFNKIEYLNIKIDIAINYKNKHSDSCINLFLIKKFNFIKKIFFSLTKIKKNDFYSKIGFLINKIKSFKIYITKEFCSHGIFNKLHNKIIIYHNINKNKKKIKNFDSFTIEPMFNYGNCSGYFFLDIFFSKKNFYTFQWEHTMYILNNKKIITTIRKTELC